MKHDTPDRRGFLALFAGALAAGVTGLALTHGEAEALPLPASPPATPEPAAVKAPASEDDIAGAKAEKTQYYYVRRRRFYRRRRFFRRRRYVYARRPYYYRRPRRVYVYRRPVRYYRY